MYSVLSDINLTKLEALGAPGPIRLVITLETFRSTRLKTREILGQESLTLYPQTPQATFSNALLNLSKPSLRLIQQILAQSHHHPRALPNHFYAIRAYCCPSR
jgi:hypothetical protein